MAGIFSGPLVPYWDVAFAALYTVSRKNATFALLDRGKRPERMVTKVMQCHAYEKDKQSGRNAKQERDHR